MAPLDPAEDVCSELLQARDPVVSPSKPRLLGILGPGLITGASDDDPSGIATYSQAGAQMGFGSLWMMLFSYPLMAVTQEISARIGLYHRSWTGGDAPATLSALARADMHSAPGHRKRNQSRCRSRGDGRHRRPPDRWPRAPLRPALRHDLRVDAFLLQTTRYVAGLKWLTLGLLAYFGTVLMVDVPWDQALRGLVVPRLSLDKESISTLVASSAPPSRPTCFSGRRRKRPRTKGSSRTAIR